jgi:predicted homoserine dehydrogenase-like protein
MAELRAAAPLALTTAAPFYLAADSRLNRNVRAGDTIHVGDLELDPSSSLLKLRIAQDKLFFGA